jgi:hypothetical protein
MIVVDVPDPPRLRRGAFAPAARRVTILGFSESGAAFAPMRSTRASWVMAMVLPADTPKRPNISAERAFGQWAAPGAGENSSSPLQAEMVLGAALSVRQHVSRR